MSQPAYFVWEQHNVTLMRSPNYGYGIAISGGMCEGSQDTAVYVSDIVSGGPAQQKLFIDDILLSVNGVNVENVEHSFVIRLLKEAKEFIHLVVKRKISNQVWNKEAALLKHVEVTSNEQQHIANRRNQAIVHTANTILASFNSGSSSSGEPSPQADIVSKPVTNTVPLLKPMKVCLSRKDKKDPFGIVLGCKFYIKEIVPNSLAANEASLRKGDILVKLNDLNSEQLSLHEATKMLQKTKESKLNLVVRRNSLASSDSDDLSEDMQPINSGKDSADTAASVAQSVTSLPTPPPPPPPPPAIVEKVKQQPDELPAASNNNESQLSEQVLTSKQLFKPINHPENKSNRTSQFFSK